MADNALWSRRFLRGSIALAVLAMLLSIVTIGFAIVPWWRSSQAVAPAGMATKQDVEYLKDKLDAYEKRTGDLKELLTALLGITTLYGAALGVSTYFGLEDAKEKAKNSAQEVSNLVGDARRQAERLVGKVDHQADQMSLRIRSKFPFFADLDVTINSILDEVALVLPTVDWSEEESRYFEMSGRLKGEVLFYENAVAAFRFFDMHKYREQEARIYHGLGNFYGVRYKLETHDPNDRDRSAYYLERSVELNGRDFTALNDCGYFYLEVAPDLAKARRHFTRSLEIRGNQQRAVYNLSLIEHKEHHYEEAEKLLTIALGLGVWELHPAPARCYDMLYNRACARARLALEPKNSARADELSRLAFEDLQKAYSKGGTPERRILEPLSTDLFDKTGDLYALSRHPAYQAAIKALAARLHVTMPFPHW